MDENSDGECQQIERYPLLMAHQQQQSLPPEQTLVVTVDPQSQPQHHAPPPPPPSSTSSSSGNTSSSSSSLRTNSARNYVVPRQRISPLNSGLWISIELTITVSQIVASVIVLSLSRDEKPQAPLSVWVAGYAAGCLATLPLLYWRYTHRHGGASSPGQEQQPETPSHSASSTASMPPSPRAGGSSYVALTMPPAAPGETDARARHRDSDSTSENSGVGRMVEKLKIALDCFFAVWFVVGNVWIFGGHSSSREAPNLYRLCIVFLTFSCIGYAMPFILCATICCCLPCIIALLGFREEQAQNRGASPELIASLPTYKFKAGSRNSGSRGKDSPGQASDSESETSVEGGFVAAGTDKERAVSADDAVCCICLARYRDGEPLRELSCSHHFHVDCVDKWLKINASCPLCKLEVGGSNDHQNSSAAGAGNEAPANEARSV